MNLELFPEDQVRYHEVRQARAKANRTRHSTSAMHYNLGLTKSSSDTYHKDSQVREYFSRDLGVEDEVEFDTLLQEADDILFQQQLKRKIEFNGRFKPTYPRERRQQKREWLARERDRRLSERNLQRT